MIFRNDDVNANTNLEEVRKMYELLKEYVPGIQIYTAVNILAKKNDKQLPHPVFNPKNVVRNDMDLVWDFRKTEGLGQIISHGIAHLDHKHASNDMQKFSIIASCRLLKTNIFVPPFWRWNKKTEEICESKGIKLWVNEDWRNFDNEPFDINHSHFLMHSWKFTYDTFREKLLTDLGLQEKI